MRGVPGERFSDRREVEIVAALPVEGDAVVDCRDPSDPGWGVRRFGLANPARVGDRWVAGFAGPCVRYPEGAWRLLKAARNPETEGSP